MAKKILIADDDPDILLALTDRLQQQDYEVITADDGLQALQLIKQDLPDLVLLDLKLLTLSGIDILKHLQHKPNVPPVVMLTAFGTMEQAVEAMKLGAENFILKPFTPDYLLAAIEKALEQETLKREAKFWHAQVDARYDTIIAESSIMNTIMEKAQRIAPTNATVLLLGETGTGKELVGRAIHRGSPRHAHPFLVINCTALPESLLENELFGHEKGAFTGANERREGRIEAAERGTVFLDEIGDMPMAIQGRLLRLLQNKELYRLGGTRPIHVNVRFMAATNKDLRQGVKAGTFREDLFFRLNSFPITLPPLRDHMMDLSALAILILKREANENKTLFKPLSQEALAMMRDYPWPGNIRELENVLARAIILCAQELICLGPDTMAIETPKMTADVGHNTYHEALEAYSKTLILAALQATGWNQTKAATLLNLNRTHLTKLIKQKRIPIKLPPLEKRG